MRWRELDRVDIVAEEGVESSLFACSACWVRALLRGSISSVIVGGIVGFLGIAPEGFEESMNSQTSLTSAVNLSCAQKLLNVSGLVKMIFAPMALASVVSAMIVGAWERCVVRAKEIIKPLNTMLRASRSRSWVQRANRAHNYRVILG